MSIERSELAFLSVMLKGYTQTDPHGSLLWLDFLAVKANNLDWLTQVAEAMDVNYLPGFAYNKALGLRIKNQGKVRSSKVVLGAVIDQTCICLSLNRRTRQATRLFNKQFWLSRRLS